MALGRPDPVPSLPRMPRPPAPPRRTTGGVSGGVGRAAVGSVRTGVINPPNSVYAPLPVTNPAAVAAAGITPTPAAPEVVDPTSYGYQAKIDAIMDRINGLGDMFTPSRERSAIQARNNLTDSGYFDRALLNPQSDGTNMRYDIVGQGRGQALRDALQNVLSGFNSRGALFSSAANRDQRMTTQRMNLARQRLVEAAAEQQRASIADQINQGITYSNDLRTARGEYDDWKDANAVVRRA